MNGITRCWHSRWARGACLGVAAGFLAACAGSPSTHYYTLSAVAPASAAPMAAYAGPPIEVRTVQIPPSLDRLEMVRQLSPGEVNVLDFSHWAAPLDRLTRQALTEDLAQRLPKDLVVVPGASWPARRATLGIDILSFAQEAGMARMTLSWALRQPAPPASSAAESAAASNAAAPIGGTLQLSVSAPGTDAAATAQAWSDLLAQVADRIASRIAQGPGA